MALNSLFCADVPLRNYSLTCGKNATNFVAMATRVNDGRLTKIIYSLHSWNLLLDARISGISRTLCRVIARFVTNFVPIATRFSRGKIRLVAFASPSPNPRPYKRRNLANISYSSWVIANFVTNVVAMATGVGWEKCDWQHSVAHPRKLPIGAKISQTSLTQTELLPILSQISLPWQPGKVRGKIKWHH